MNFKRVPNKSSKRLIHIGEKSYDFFSGSFANLL